MGNRNSPRKLHHLLGREGGISQKIILAYVEVEGSKPPPKKDGTFLMVPNKNSWLCGTDRSNNEYTLVNVMDWAT